MALANTLVDAVVHIEYDKEQRVCKACGETAPFAVAMTNNSAVEGQDVGDNGGVGYGEGFVHVRKMNDSVQSIKIISKANGEMGE